MVKNKEKINKFLVFYNFMKAFILATIGRKEEKGGALELAILEKIRKMKEVEEAYLVFGEWDLLIKVKEIDSQEQLSNFVINKIRRIE